MPSPHLWVQPCPVAAGTNHVLPRSGLWSQSPTATQIQFLFSIWNWNLCNETLSPLVLLLLSTNKVGKLFPPPALFPRSSEFHSLCFPQKSCFINHSALSFLQLNYVFLKEQHTMAHTRSKLSEITFYGLQQRHFWQQTHFPPSYLPPDSPSGKARNQLQLVVWYTFQKCLEEKKIVSSPFICAPDNS